MTLKLTNNTNKKSYNIAFSDENSSNLYYFGNITLPSGMADGEYNYELIDDEEVVAKGLLQIGDYNKNPQKIKVYGK